MPGTTFYIDDNTNNDVLFDKRAGRGLTAAKGYGAVGQSVPKGILKYNKSELEVLLKEREKEGRGTRELFKMKGIKHKDQKQIPYCWIFATVMMLQGRRAWQNEPQIDLSPASTGCKITGFKERGGYGEEACRGIDKYGVCLTVDWPDTAISKKYDTPENWSRAEGYKFGIPWLNLTPRDMVELANVIIELGVASCGYNHWSHQVLVTDCFIRDGIIVPEILNQWYEGWGDDNYAILLGSKAPHNDGVSALTAVAGYHKTEAGLYVPQAV